MNNFNDYYNYLNNNYNDMNFLADPNSMIYDMNYQALYPNAVMPTNNNILDTKLGFKRGNLFNNLYDEYKNYKPQELKANNEKEDLLLQIDEQRFDEILKEEFDEMPLIKQFIDLIQEPLVKYSLKEQYQKLENYVDTQA